MPAPTHFRVFQVDTQTSGETEDVLNDLASRADVAEIVDWETVDSAVARKANLIVEYRPEEPA